MKPLWISTAYDEEQPMNKENEFYLKGRRAIVTGGRGVSDGQL